MLLIFMFAFFFLGYSPFLSICLGAIAGLTSGFISAWWHAKDDFITDEATETSERTTSSIDRQSRSVQHGFGVKTSREARAARAVWQFGWLFRRKR